MKRDKLFLNQVSTQPTEIKFDKSFEFMQNILNDLHEGLESSEIEMIGDQENISFEGTVERKLGTRYGDYALVRGSISAEFYTHCVVSGELMKDQIHTEVKATFIDESYGERFQLEEETTLFLNDEEYELYYLDNNKVDLPKVINEFVFLNKNPYPKKLIQPID